MLALGIVLLIRIAYTVLDFEHMTPENGFEERYSIDESSAYSVIKNSDDIVWTKKIPTAVKNIFRKHFNMKPLVDDGKEVLWGGMTPDQYLCKQARDAAKARGHDLKPFKKGTNWCGKQTHYLATCKACGKEVFVTTPHD